MTATLTVRDVRDALLEHANPGEGDPSTAMLGSLFHETFAGLLPLVTAPGVAPVADEDAGAPPLLRIAYDRFVGPRLRRDRARLHGDAARVLSFWSAVKALTTWLDGLRDGSAVVSTEESLSCELVDSNWSAPVRLTGIADAVVRIPATGQWCVVELKLGRNAPEADLGQAVLYHLIASKTSETAGGLALLSFGPELVEHRFTEAELIEARPALLDLIGRLAGVLTKGPPRAEGRPAATSSSPTEPSPAHFALGRRLVDVLAEYGVEVSLEGTPIVGPAFIRFPVRLGTGVRVSAVERHAPEVRVRLGLDAPPRIGIDGCQVVVDVQRPDRQLVPFASIREGLGPIDSLEGSARVPIGVGLDGGLATADLSRPEHAHLLVAGTTGSGKSEWLRTALAGLILSNTPETLRLILIDPKRNAFTWLRNSPFLLRPIVYPGDDASVFDVLSELAQEMEQRYRWMGDSESDTIAEHIRRTGVALPRIVCVVDEYADLVRGDREERKRIEEQVSRLGSKARAAGIHLILATQQPSREVIKGALDANIPARIGLRMERSIESRMLLSQSGAETLLGFGDLLFKDIGEPVRLQAALLDPDDRASIGQPAAVPTPVPTR